MTSHYVDAAHEPWARAAVKRHDPLTQEQAEALIATIDQLRGLLAKRDSGWGDLLAATRDVLRHGEYTGPTAPALVPRMYIRELSTCVQEATEAGL